MQADAFKGQRVLVTGHTGFKGAWLVLWVYRLGARVTGYALPPPTRPSLFDVLGLADLIEHRVGDVRDASRLARVVRAAQPDIVFHLAAQSLVRRSYADPLGTIATNVLGTAALLEACRALRKPCAVIVVTSDKCYENRNTQVAYRETDRLGGHDPYSMSKACAELVAASYRRAFFQADPDAVPRVGLATARAGNVIGGGDWSPDRIVPDCIRALRQGQPIGVRHPEAVRPWQHVLDALGGYLLLAEQLRRALRAAAAGGPRSDAARQLDRLTGPFNFGPPARSLQTVQELVEALIAGWGSGAWRPVRPSAARHEAALLALSSAKAHAVLGWRNRWGFRDAVQATVEWYRAWDRRDGNLRERALAQIAAYTAGPGKRCGCRTACGTAAGERGKGGATGTLGGV